MQHYLKKQDICSFGDMSFYVLGSEPLLRILETNNVFLVCCHDFIIHHQVIKMPLRDQNDLGIQYIKIMNNVHPAHVVKAGMGLQSKFLQFRYFPSFHYHENILVAGWISCSNWTPAKLEMIQRIRKVFLLDRKLPWWMNQRTEL